MYSIVIADDEEELRNAIIRKIDWTAIGFVVVGDASNGIEALELIEKKEADLLLTDIKMPFLSGIELAREVREIRPATHIAFLSGFDDFSYAQQAIQYNVISYLLKPITLTDLTEKLVEIKKKMDEIREEFYSYKRVLNDSQTFVVPLLLDEYSEVITAEREKQLLEHACSCELIQNTKIEYYFTVIAVKMRDQNGINKTNIDLVSSINFILKKYIKYYSFYTEGKIVSLLIATKASFDKYLHIIVDEITQNIERILSFCCDIGVSRMVNKLSSCHEAYREAVNALSYSVVQVSNVHYIGDEERSDFNLAAVPDILLEVENLLRGGTKESLERYLTHLFENLSSDKSYKVDSKIKIVLVQIFAVVCKTLYVVSDMDDRVEGWDDTMLIQMNFFEGNILETKKKFIEMCEKARGIVSFSRKKSGEILSDQVMYIIEKEYQDPSITLVSVSSKINVSPNYLSTLMKKQVGQSFVDLLTKKRLETAEKLLLSTSMKVREITEKCGYKDQHYFSYCFKKYFGISPNLLRQQTRHNSLEKQP